MSFPQYPDYKDSGVEWLEEVPAHWSIKPLKYLTNFINGMAFKPSEWSLEGTPIIRIENLNDSESFNFYDGEVDDRYHVKKGDLLFGWSGNKGTSFGPYVWGKEGLFYLNQHIFRLAELSVDKKWLYWTLKAVTKTIEDQAHGIIGMVHVTKGKLGGIPVPQLPKNEQQAIAAFLDHETTRLDALVGEQQRLIELLKEKRQAVISHAVTKGLDPDVPMKDSGVEWLGEVPKHWDTIRVKHACLKVTDGAHISPETENGEYPFVSTRDISDGCIDLQNCLLTSPASYQYLVKMGCQPSVGDILFSKDGTIGEIAVVPQGEKFVVASSLIILRVIKTLLLPEFLGFSLRSSNSLEQAECFVKGAALRRLSIQNILKFWIVVPPVDEQKAIIEMLCEYLNSNEILIKNSERLMALLRERRSALISTAVTGKIDVRGWQPPEESQAANDAQKGHEVATV